MKILRFRDYPPDPPTTKIIQLIKSNFREDTRQGLFFAQAIKEMETTGDLLGHCLDTSPQYFIWAIIRGNYSLFYSHQISIQEIWYLALHYGGLSEEKLCEARRRLENMMN